MQSNSYFIPLLEEFLKHFDIRSDRKDLQLLLQSSPSFPSVLSIIQTCVYFGLNTKAYKADYDVLLKNNMPVLVHLKEDSDEKFVLVDLRHVQKLNGWDSSQVGGIELLIDDYAKMDELGEKVNLSIGYKLKAETIKQIYPNIFEWLLLFDTNVIVLLVITIFVCIITMISTFFIIVLLTTAFGKYSISSTTMCIFPFSTSTTSFGFFIFFGRIAL